MAYLVETRLCFLMTFIILRQFFVWSSSPKVSKYIRRRSFQAGRLVYTAFACAYCCPHVHVSAFFFVRAVIVVREAAGSDGSFENGGHWGKKGEAGGKGDNLVYAARSPLQKKELDVCPLRMHAAG